MTIYNLGSINADHFYDLPHLPQPGETLAADRYRAGLGGKGANMSVAAARAGSDVHHIGAVGPDGGWMVDRLAGYGVDVTHVARLDVPSGHAIITVDAQGENAIVLFPGANVAQDAAAIETALYGAGPGDTLVMQNETDAQAFCAEIGSKKGMRVAYTAAPFDAGAVRAVLPFVDILFLNAVELAQLREATGMAPAGLGPDIIIVTEGGAGGHVMTRDAGFAPQRFATPQVTPVDTTGAGDTFTGYMLAGLDQGLNLDDAITQAAAAAALKVTRAGTADAIPTRAEVQAFRATL